MPKTVIDETRTTFTIQQLEDFLDQTYGSSNYSVEEKNGAKKFVKEFKIQTVSTATGS